MLATVRLLADPAGVGVAAAPDAGATAFVFATVSAATLAATSALVESDGAPPADPPSTLGEFLERSEALQAARARTNRSE